jgi:hypothetical protein
MNAYEEFPELLPAIETMGNSCIQYYHAGLSQGITFGSLMTMMIIFFCGRRIV